MESMNQSVLTSSFADICRSIFDSTSGADLVNKVIESGIHLLQCERGTIFLSSETGFHKSAHRLKSLIATGLDGDILSIDDSKGIAGHVYQTQKTLAINDVSEDSRFLAEIDAHTSYKTKSVLCVPMRSLSNKIVGTVEFLNSQKSGFSQQDIEVAEILATFAGIALEQLHKIETLEQNSNAIIGERNRKFSKVPEKILLSSEHEELQKIFEQLPAYADSDSHVLVTGESGTGKELIAKYIHLKSQRNQGPFVVLNCASIPETLFEAELFGIVKGAATGTHARKGKVELADRGTLFLDEIGEMPLSMQAKLLRVLQDKIVVPVGAERGHGVNFRLLAATNRDLQKMAQEGKFREDLFYRLNVLQVQLVPLRLRKKDLPQIAESIILQFSQNRGWKPKKLSAAAMRALMDYDWPGNIRELQNLIERAFIISGDRSELTERDFDLHLSKVSAEVAPEPRSGLHENIFELPFKDAKLAFEAYFIKKELQRADGNKSQASLAMGLSREGLRKAMLKHGIKD